MGGGGDGGSKIGGGVELTEAVLTCEGHISDPQLPSKLSHLASCLQRITESDKWLVRKVEPFNSVKVTFSIPREAAERLYLLAQSGDAVLHQLGILSVQVEGDQVISLKVNGPNNEPAEILLRPNDNHSSSNEVLAPPGMPRQPSHSFAVPSVVGGPAILKTQSIPQFRNPTQALEGNAAIVNRQVVGHPRSVQQGFNLVESMIGAQRGPQQQQQLSQGVASPVQTAPTQRVVSVATRPGFPSNPPPPYPGQDVTREGSNVHAMNHASVHKAGPSQVAATPLIPSHTQSSSNSFRALPGHTTLPNNTILQPGRGFIRAPMNMVKNSPLLVGLLQSPEQNSPIVKSTKISSSLPMPHNVSRVSENSPASPALTSVSTVPVACSSGTSVSRSSRESTPTLQQIYTAGSVMTNSLPNQLPTTASPKPQVLGNSQSQLSTPKPQHTIDKRISSAEGIRYLPVASSSQEHSVRGGLVNSIKKEEISGSSSMHNKKDSQYLINPNTGLLELRPSTDSSDSEPEGKGSSTGNNSLPSDDESSNSSKKELDISRTKIPSHKEKMQDRGAASWHNSLISSGEKIKLKLKLGREPCAQTTIIGNKKAEKRRESTSNSLGTPEPRVPKLHIKLHSSQPVIVKSIEDTSISEDDSKSTKFRKKFNRNKLREDELKFKSTKHRDAKSTDDISTCFLRLSEMKRLRDSDHNLEGAKVPKLCDDSKITISKSSRTDKSRKQRKPIRKIGDLNSLGEIASHKIMETLPPAITKVADMHTQHQSPSPTISPLFTSTSHDPLGTDGKFDSTGKELLRNMPSTETREHPAVPGKSNSFFPNGDVCVGAVVNKMVLNPAETSTYRDSPEGLGSVKTFLKSSVLINKVSTGKPAYNNCINSYRVVEDGPEKIFKKLDGFKSCDYPIIRTASDITIQSVSKNELINPSKLEASKPKPENKVGRVLCVDVMDRKALEEALKSSRDSVKKAETSLKDPTTSMVDRLRRWNSIDNSSPVPLNSHQTSDSTNLLPAAVKGECSAAGRDESGSLADGEGGKSSCEKTSTEASFQRQSVKVVASVNSKGDCDNSCALSNLPVVDICHEGTSSINTAGKPNKKECLVESNISDAPSKPAVSMEEQIEGIVPGCNTSKSEGKAAELVSAKADVDSPEGTPKGDHGNGQGGEDSGIESMDALSEKSPNHSDQSPHRREDKECDIYSMKCKDACDPVQQKEPETSCNPRKELQPDESTDCSEYPQSSCFMGKEENPTVVNENVSVAGTKHTGTEICAEIMGDIKITMKVEEINHLEDSSESSRPSNNSSTPLIQSESCTSISATSEDGDNDVMCISSETTTSAPVPVMTSSLSTGISSVAASPPLIVMSPITVIASTPPVIVTSIPPAAVTSIPPVTVTSILPATVTSIPPATVTPTSPVTVTPTPHATVKSTPRETVIPSTSVTVSLSPSVTVIPSTSLTVMPSTSVTVHNIVSSKDPQTTQNNSYLKETKKTLIGNTPVSLTTTIANSSIILQKFLTSNPSSNSPMNTQSSSLSGTANIIPPHNKVINNSIPNAKPSLLAITLTRPPGSGIINSQYAASLAINLDQQAVDDFKSNEPKTEVKSSTESDSTFPSNNSLTSTTTTSTSTMIILATTTNPTSCTNSLPSNSKITSVKPSSVQAISSAINPPVGKAFRLVALPGINSVAPVSGPVRGQIVTLKPIIGVPGPTSVLPAKLDIQPAVQTIVKEDHITNHLSSEAEVEDLDFVGFSSAKKAEECRESCQSTVEPCVSLMSPTEEEPTPMRVQPPLYTYGNKERKKESELDFEDKEKEPKPTEDIQVVEEKVSGDEVPVDKLKDKMLDPLTIDIPALESIPDDKRLTRATRQSARLSSPKVSSTTGDLSPHPDKKLATVVGISKPTVRSSVSPALRGTKRRRHESESSNASSVSEDLQDPSSKNRRRKITARDELLKERATKFKEAELEKDKAESSDEDCQMEQASVNSTCTDDGSTNASKSGPTKDKDAVNLRENVRRASRQKCQTDKDEPGESTEGKIPSAKVGVKVVSSVKPKKENVEQSETDAGRRKTRSTAVSEEVPNKRRRQSKEK